MEKDSRGSDLMEDESMENDSTGSDSMENDDEYVVEKETDLGDQEDQDYDKYLDKCDQFEEMADKAPAHDDAEVSKEKGEVPGTQMTILNRENQKDHVGRQRQVLEKGKNQNKGRGPNKGFRVMEPMYLEYNEIGQPCGRWRKRYRKYVGICLRKLSILLEFDEVSEGLKKTMWEDVANLFHIQPPHQPKKKVFESLLARRFRDFKAKLVSGWITLRRPRTKGKKRKRDIEKEIEEAELNENEEVGVAQNEEGNNNAKTKKSMPKCDPPKKMPYEIWPHISKDEWEAFVAKKTTPEQVKKRAQNSANANKKEYHHHLGPRTYDEARSEWIEEGFYPTITSASSVASTSVVTNVKVDRTSDWYCGLHGKDESGKRTISDPGVREIAEAVLGWKQKEARGEFTPVGEKDALYMVLGKDHAGHVRGKGGVRVGLRKAFGEEYSASKATPSNTTSQDMDAIRASIQSDIEKKLKRQFTAILEKAGIPVDLEELDVNPDDKMSEIDPLIPDEVNAKTPESRMIDRPIPDLVEDTPCDLLLPESGGIVGDLIVVAYGRARPLEDGQKVHLKTLESCHFSVGVDSILDGFNDFQLPMKRPEWSIFTLNDALGSYVSWPCAWLRFPDEVLKKAQTDKDVNQKKDGSQGNKEVSRTKRVSAQENAKNTGSQERDKELEEGKKAKPKSSSMSRRRLSSKGSTSYVTPTTKPFVEVNVLQSLSKACSWLHNCVSLLPDNVPIEVDLDPSQFHYSTTDSKTWLNKVDIREFLARKMLNVTLIQVFMRALAENLQGCESVSKVGWFCPEEVCETRCLNNQGAVKEYLYRAITECTEAGEKFIFAPYNEDFHWLLLVISPSNHTVYVFDSARPGRNEIRNLLIRSPLNSEMKKIYGSSGLRKHVVPTWKAMRCAQQENGVDCALYVMRFMLDIVSSCTSADDIETVLNTPREDPFTEAELNVVRDKIATFLTDNCL